MNWKNYWNTLVGSMTSPIFYREILKQSWWFSFRFYVITMLVIGLILSVTMIKVDFPRYQQQLQQILQEAQTNYPADLEIKWDQTHLSTSQTEPVQVTYPSSWTRPADFPERVLIIDPDSELVNGSPANLAHSALAVVTSQQLFLTDFKGQWSELALKELPGFDQAFVINQANFPNLTQAISHRFDQILAIVQKILPWVLPILIVMAQFFDALLYASIGFFMLRLFSKTLSFSQVWQIALHLTIIAFSINQLANYLYQQNLIFLYPLTFWVLFIVVIWNLEKKTAKTGG